MPNFDTGSRDLDRLRLSDADSDVLANDCSDFALTSRGSVDVDEPNSLSSAEDF